MEDEIIKIIIKLLYESKYDDMYVNKKGINELEFPLKIKTSDFENIPFNVLADFNDNYFYLYKDLLFKNALIYALDNHKTEYIKFIDKNKIDIKKLLDEDYLFKIHTTNNAIKNIKNKVFNKIDNSKSIQKKYPEYFNLLSSYNIITNICRDICFKAINVAKDDEEMFMIIDLLIYTNKLDFIIKDVSNCDLSSFKFFLKRVIIGDNYLYLENTNDELESEDFLADKNEVLECINYCLDNNSLDLPTSSQLRHKVYENFIIYNFDVFGKDNDLSNLKKNGSYKKLIKINPLSYLQNFFK